MRRLLTWLVVTLGIAALVRRLRRRASTPETYTADPAGELRQKLAESRAEEPTSEAAAPPERSVDERRADVHAEGRAALDEMRSGES